MTVEELIEELKRHPGHVEVRVLMAIGIDDDLAPIDRVSYSSAPYYGKPCVQLEVAP